MPETEIVDGEAEEIEEVTNLPAVRASEAIVVRGEISVEEIVAQHDKIVQVMDAVMTENVHYGLIPGVNKPSLFKPGAETLCVALRLAPHYDSERIWHDDGHLTVVSKCELHHIPTGLVIATGEGLCSSRETRYAYRQGARLCPNCESPNIKRSKYPPRSGDYDGANPNDSPGWYCFAKTGGCGMNFAHDDARITSQSEGRVENPDLPDTFNTVLKMADKRALVAAVLNGTAASDVFTQDVEDQPAAAPPTPAPDPPPAPVNRTIPKSWKEISALVGEYGTPVLEDFNLFGAAARKLLFGEEDLSTVSKDELFALTVKAAVALRDAVDPATFPGPGRDDLRKAWASVLEGQELAISGDDS